MNARDHIEREGGLAIQEIIQESTPWTCFQNRLELALLVDEWNHVLEDQHIMELTPEAHLVRVSQCLLFVLSGVVDEIILSGDT